MTAEGSPDPTYEEVLSCRVGVLELGSAPS